MSLTLIKEDGTGKPDANVYADAADGGLTLMFLPTMIVCNKLLLFDGVSVAVSCWKCWMRQTKKLLTNPDWKNSF